MSQQNLESKSTVIRTYRMGIRFDGTKEEKRTQEKEANLRVKGLQIQQDDIYHYESAIETALNIARTQPKQQSKFAVKAIQKAKQNYSNIADSAYYWLYLASKGTVDREKKVAEIMKLLLNWDDQAVEWFIFGRSPRVENTLIYRWKLKRLYVINLISSTRWQIDKFCTPDIKFNSFLPLVTQQEVEDNIHAFCTLKSQEKQTKNVSDKARRFIKRIELVHDNLSIVAPYLTSWINVSQKSRWKSLKRLSKIISGVIGLKNENLFSALRAIIVFALSPYIEKNVSRILQYVSPEQIVKPPFMKNRRRNIPIILLMNKDHVILRPGNSSQMTELVKKNGMFDLVFILKNQPRIYGTLVFSSKVRKFIERGAKIKVLMVQSGPKPGCKLRISVILEGHCSIFLSTKLTENISKQLKIKQTDALGLDVNRLGEYVLVFSVNVKQTKELKELMKRYNRLNTLEIPRLSVSLKNYGRLKHSYRYVKVRGELQRIYKKRNNLLKEIKNYVTHYIAAVLIKSKCKIFCIEDFRIDPRGKRGALAKAIYSMPDDENIFEKAISIASLILKYNVSLISIDPRRTSSLHNNCGGILKRTSKSYDIVKCNKCSKQVNTHTNAALNIRDKGMKYYDSPFPHARGMG